MAEEGRRFSFACFPLERVLVLTCALAGAAIAGLVQWQYGLLRSLSAHPALEHALDGGPSRPLVGGVALLGLVLVLYAVLYLQMRAATSAVVTARGLHVQRVPLLPFGLLGRRRELWFTDVRRAELTTRRGWLGVGRPTLEVETPRSTVRLSVADAWPEPGPSRPWVPRPPAGGWARHPLVEAVTSGFAAAAVERLAAARQGPADTRADEGARAVDSPVGAVEGRMLKSDPGLADE
jgi:hypothetical protein